MSEVPTLSVVLAALGHWPAVQPVLSDLLAQTCVESYEIVIADGDGRGLPPDAAERFGERVVWVQWPRASANALRAAGAQAARGEIIAFTEDHARVPADWCHQHLAAHRKDPNALAVIGSLENGSRSRVSDWANYLLWFHAIDRPWTPGRPVPPLLSNTSLKRAALDDWDGRPGALELDVIHGLAQAGRVDFDEAIVSQHDQPVTVRDGLRQAYYVGRAAAGHPADWDRARARQRLRPSHPSRPFRAGRVAWREVRARSRVCMRSRLALGVVPALWASHQTGELVGILAGPGRSAEQIDRGWGDRMRRGTPPPGHEPMMPTDATQT
jgi:hypothetical protein